MTITRIPDTGADVRPFAFPPGRTPLGITVAGLAFVPASSNLWRVVSTNGTVLGHIERRSSVRGDRYAARMLLAGGQRELPLGEFWSPLEASECFV
jgi:hypothetical protein